jgi:hypothetical protein
LMSLSYTEGTSGGLTDLTAGCALNGGGAGDLDDDDENEESSGN